MVSRVTADSWQINSLQNSTHSQDESAFASFFQILTRDMNESSKQQIFDTISFVPMTERTELIKNANQLITANMNLIDKIDIILFLTTIAADERDLLTTLALIIITEEMDRYSRRQILGAIGSIPSDEREEVIKNAANLITDQMNTDDREGIIQSIVKVPKNERDLVAALTLSVITQEAPTNFRKEIIREITAITASEREAVIQNAANLFKDQLREYDKLYIIQGIAKVPKNERDLVTTLTLSVLTQKMKGVCVKKVIDAITSIASDEREEIIQSAANLVTDQMHVNDVLHMIQVVAETPAGSRDHFAKNRKRGIFTQAPADLARQGLNVHEKDRDERTKAALELLYSHQGAISNDRIRQAKDQFIAYLEHSTMDQSKKTLAYDALLKPREGTQEFGPLIGNTNFSILGFDITGENLIGRLWLYTSELSENEKINARKSMVSALANSYEMGSRICNQGKTQRLVVATLQGRLRGVKIDEVTTLTNAQAVEMFFNVEAHRDIEDLKTLLEAANKFCHENGAINREEFIQEIRQYAKAQDIT